MNRDLLTAFDAELQKLIALLPVVHGAVGNLAPLDTEPRWRRLRENADALALRKLPLVALVGPTGSGKSTLFHLLSGIDVPRGGARKPNTHNCVVAVPQKITENELRARFPESQLRELDNPSDLRDPQLPRETLFYRTMSNEAAARGDFLLCDVPDFNTICLENWEKAKLMLGRSEVVIFVVHKITYAHYVTMFYLARTCAHAGHLAYVITMANRDEASEIHTDLIDQKCREFHLKNDDLDEDAAHPFSEPRADGQHRGEFLARADFYSSEERKEPEQPKLEDIQALANGAPPLADLLRGRNIARLMLTKRANDIQQGLSLADATIVAHREQLVNLQRTQSAVLKELNDESLDIVGAQLPLGDVLENVIHEAEAGLPSRVKFISRMINAPLKLLREAGTGVVSLLRGLKDFISSTENVRPLRRDLIEREALRDQSSRLADRWRARYEGVVSLTQESCTAALNAFETEAIPEPDTEWHAYAAASARAWVAENPGKGSLLLAGRGILGLLAPLAVTVDLLTSGGLVTLTVSPWLAIGEAVGGSLVIAALLHKLIDRLGMQPLAMEFQKEWKHQRNRQLRVHLLDHFARPLVLHMLDQQIGKLRKAPASECASAANALRFILAENVPASMI